MSRDSFILHSNYPPSGDQPEAIARLIDGIENGVTHQTLQGVTGSGKTFTMANMIHRLQRPTLILAHNKTLAAQLYSEMKHFFPENAVEYFVSYYDYYQPEVYIPAGNRFIRKDSAINEQLERLRLSTTKSLIERKDVIVIASVSAIYGLGAPELYRAAQLLLSVGKEINFNELTERLSSLQYSLCKQISKRATFCINGNIFDIFPADSEYKAIRITVHDDTIDSLEWIDPMSGKVFENIENYTVSPKTLYAASKEKLMKASVDIQRDMEARIEELNNENRITEAARLYERTTHDIEMMQQLGYCSGLENYSTYLNDRDPALPPTTLLDYLPKDGLLFIDESHAMIPQISAMYHSDQSRKDTLINYGFRLPSARNNRPLNFSEFEKLKPQTIFVSATPGKYELEKSKSHVAQQLIRPTGLLDPLVEIRPLATQVADLMQEISLRISRDERVLVTALTKKSAELLYEMMQQKGVKVSYIHSDVKTEDRVTIIDGLRSGEFDVLIGINLLREGLDIPEASLIAVLNADHAGFLRSTQALIQMIGRVARNMNGIAILYADKVTPAMQQAIDNSTLHREQQLAFNKEHKITPRSPVRKRAKESEVNNNIQPHTVVFCSNLSELCQQITQTEKLLLTASDAGNRTEIENIRYKLDHLYRQFIFM
ncbi:excinuclease ABC subunit UvrB [Aliivibrio salmonicida]|uniref:excinuclease ABC subunit UvrB n=1 Tax=Aliivibrio salmonicida TaxID=40269 RepID=UPI003D131B26